LDGEGSVRAPNCSSIPKVASGAQSGTPGHSGQSATIGMSQPFAIIRSRQGAPATLERHGRRPRRPWRAIWRRGGNCRGKGEREHLRHGYCAVLGGIDRLAYPVMDARLWLGRANARPPRVRPEPMRRARPIASGCRRHSRKSVSVTRRDPARPFSQRGTSEVGLTFEEGPC